MDGLGTEKEYNVVPILHASRVTRYMDSDSAVSNSFSERFVQVPRPGIAPSYAPSVGQPSSPTSCNLGTISSSLAPLDLTPPADYAFYNDYSDMFSSFAPRPPHALPMAPASLPLSRTNFQLGPSNHQAYSGPAHNNFSFAHPAGEYLPPHYSRERARPEGSQTRTSHRRPALEQPPGAVPPVTKRARTGRGQQRAAAPSTSGQSGTMLIILFFYVHISYPLL